MSFLSKRASNMLIMKEGSVVVQGIVSKHFNPRLFNTNLQPQWIEILTIEKFMVEEFKVEKLTVEKSEFQN